MDLSPLVQIFERLSNDVKIELARTFPIGQRECPKTIQNCISLLKGAKKCGMYSSDEKLIRSFLHKNDAVYLESHLSDEQTKNLDSFLDWFAGLGLLSTRSRKPNHFLKKAFKESTQEASESCQTLWLRLVSDYKEAYERNELDERDKEKIIDVFLRALRSDRVRRKLKSQYDLLHFEWEKRMSFARQARFFEEEEKDFMTDGGTSEILNYLKDKLNLTNCDSFSHKRRKRYRDRSDSPESYSKDHEENRNRDRNRRERSESRGRVRYRSGNRYGHEYRRDSSQSHNDRYRDSSRYHNGGNNDGHYRSSRNNNENLYGRDPSPNHDFRSNRVRHFSDADPDYQGN